jgi:cytochrome P450
LNPEIVEEYRSFGEGSDKKEKLARFIIKETMRLYPAAPFLTRILPAENYVGGYKLPPGVSSQII